MKKVIVMRHSESSNGLFSVKDFDRPLSEQGAIDAPVMGQYLNSKNLMPDLIICSPALRAKMTIELILKNLKKNIDIIYNMTIYENYSDNIIKLISLTNDNINTLMITGHNPSIYELACYLTNNNLSFNSFNTSGIAVIDLDVSRWSSIIGNYGKLESYASPKMLT